MKQRVQSGSGEQRREHKADAGVEASVVTDEEPVESLEQRCRARPSSVTASGGMRTGNSVIR